MNAPLAHCTREYLAAGFFPIRVAANGKFPLDAGWPTARPTDDEVESMFAQHQGNIGITFPCNLFAIDIDCKNGTDGRAMITALEFHHGPLPPTLTQSTPSGGEHRIFRLPAGVKLTNKVAIAPGIDIRTAGGQIVVEPSMIDGKPYRWIDRNACIADIPQPWLDMLIEKSATPQAFAPPSGDTRIPEGMRNATLHRMAAAMQREGFTSVALHDALQSHNRDRCEPPLDEAEIAMIATSAGKYQANPEPWEVFGHALLPSGVLLAPPTPDRAERVSICDLFSNPPAPQRFLIDQILPGGVVTLLGAHGGAGKSMLALTAAVCLVTGRQFIGKAVEKCRVLFYSGEDPAPVVRRRLSKICRNMGVDPQELAIGLMVLDATDRPVLYNTVGTAALAALRLDVAEFDPGAIIIDNASDAYDANEIERARVREFIRLLASLGKEGNAAILLLAHVDKNTARAGQSSEGYSGSTAWHNSARSRLFLTGADGRLTLEHQKSNFGMPSEPIHLVWTADGMLDRADAPGGDNDKGLVLRLLTEAYRRGEYVSTAPNSPKNAYKVLSVSPEFPKGLDRRGLAAVMHALEVGGAIRREEIKGQDRHTKEIFRPTIIFDVSDTTAGSAGSVRDVQLAALITNTPAPAGGVC